MAKRMIMERDGQSVHVDVESGSVEVMKELGWKVTGEAPPDPEPEKPAGAPSLLPALLRTPAMVQAALSQLPERGDANAIVAEMKATFGEVFTDDHEAEVRAQVKSADPDEDLGDNTGVDPQYTSMPVKQLRDLLDAKGLSYKPNDSKAKLAATLKASAKK
jgi:hypothetical protein